MGNWRQAISIMALSAIFSIAYGENNPFVSANTYKINFEKNSSQATSEGLIALKKLSELIGPELFIVVPFSENPQSTFQSILVVNRALIVYRRLIEMGVKPAQIILLEQKRDFKSRRSNAKESLDVVLSPIQLPNHLNITDLEEEAKNKDILVPDEEIEIHYNKGAIKPENSLDLVSVFAKQIKEEKDNNVIISSYASSDGTAHTNRILTLARALVIYEFITRLGVSPKNVNIEFNGADAPKPGLPSNSPDNRRVVIRSTKPLSRPKQNAPEPTPSAPVVVQEKEKEKEKFELKLPEFVIPTMSLSVFSGLESAPSSLLSVTTGTISYGLGWGIIGVLPWGMDIETRYTYRSFNRSSTGLLTINLVGQTLDLGVNQTFEDFSDTWNLILHEGYRHWWWNGKSTYLPSGVKVSDSGSDNGVYSALGMRFDPTDNKFAEAKLEVNYNFSALQGASLSILFEIGTIF